MKRFILFVPIMMLVACQTSIQPGVDSPYYAVPVGARVALNRPLVIPPDHASVYIQNGHVVSFGTRDAWEPHCQFELDTVKSTSQTIEPDEFTVHEVTQYIEVSRFPIPGLLLASMGDDNDAVDTKLYGRVLHLRSSRQPDVLQLSCQRLDSRSFARHLTIREIRDTLGDLFTLHLPPPG